MYRLAFTRINSVLFIPFSLLLYCFAVAGCVDDAVTDPGDSADGQETSDGIDSDQPNDESDEPIEEALFTRYMAFGGSFTAGFQSDGINAKTQGESYAVLVARAIGAEFHVPEIDMPGCPAPVTNAFTGDRMGEDTCRLRASPELIHNVAVPDMHLADVVPAKGDRARNNPYVALMLGGRTPLEIAAEVRPTFVTLWFGGEQFMEELLSGKPADSWFPFESHYRVLIDSLEALGVKGGVIIVPPMLDTSPYWSKASAYVEAKDRGLLPDEYEIAPNCAADSSFFGRGWYVPFPHGLRELLARTSDGESVLLNCKSDPVIDSAYWGQLQNWYSHLELDVMHLAHPRGWAYTRADLRLLDRPKFPNLPTSGEPTFGPFYSLDGLHLGPEGHKHVANQIIAAINTQYGTSFAGY